MNGCSARGMSSGAMPAPLSVMRKATPSGWRLTSACTVPPAEVNLIALDNRLSSTCRSRTVSASTVGRLSPI